MKQWTRYIFSMIIVLAFLLVADIAIIVGINLGTRRIIESLQIEKVSESIRSVNGVYVIQEEQRKRMEQRNAFLILIDENGNLVWQFQKPEDVPEHYSLSDVARFTRWYLRDYPVYTWTREDGILVVGYPKGTLWKYVTEIPIDTFEMLVTATPYVLLANILILFLFPFWLTKKWARGKERQRTEWIAGVSHDIRTPLSIVLGHSEKGGVIEKQCLRMRDMIGNLNTENKLEAGTGKWNETNINVAALLREVVCDYMNCSEDLYSIRLEVDPEMEEATICADDGLIKRMLDNLITNALRHNESASDITVDISLAKISQNKIKLCITDNGKGASRELLRKLNGKLKNEYLPEHGLGIRVVKQIAKRYRYKVNFRSDPGEGFWCGIVLSLKK
jgi:signal transduction histidine kinase